jgi:CubicO group peptidase (beta-lactamase class C family)
LIHTTTKLIVTIVVMRLVEQGCTALDDPMARYLLEDG